MCVWYINNFPTQLNPKAWNSPLFCEGKKTWCHWVALEKTFNSWLNPLHRFPVCFGRVLQVWSLTPWLLLLFLKLSPPNTCLCASSKNGTTIASTCQKTLFLPPSASWRGIKWKLGINIERKKRSIWPRKVAFSQNQMAVCSPLNTNTMFYCFS